MPPGRHSRAMSPGHLAPAQPGVVVAGARRADIDDECREPACRTGQQGGSHTPGSIFHGPQANASTACGPSQMAVTTKVTELSDSRVRLDAEVPGAEVESRVQRAAQQIGQE